MRTADKPAQPIEKRTAGKSLLAQVIIGKIADHLPLNRQQTIFARHGVDLSRKTRGMDGSMRKLTYARTGRFRPYCGDYGGCDAFFVNLERGLIEVGCWWHSRRYYYKALDSDQARMGPVLLFIPKTAVELTRARLDGSKQMDLPSLEQ